MKISVKIYKIMQIVTILSFVACNNADTGGSGPEGVTIPDAPGAPIVVAGDSQLSISWDAVPGAAFYEVWFSETDDMSKATQDGGDIVATRYVIDELTNGNIYYIWLKAKNEAGTSGFGLPASGTPEGIPGILPPDAPGTPDLFLSMDYVSITWQPVACAEFYEVWISETDDPLTAVQHGGDIEDTFYTLMGLNMDTTYYIWLKAKNAAGVSDFSQSASAILVSPPDAPGAPTVTPSDSMLFLTWDAVPRATGYGVWFRKTDSYTGYSLAGHNIQNTFFTIAGLENGETYSVFITSINSAGESVFGPEATGMPYIPGAPPIPGKAFIIPGNTSLNLSWDAVPNTDVYERWISQTNVRGTAVKSGDDLASTSGSISGLVNNAAYYIWLRAKNSAGAGGFGPAAIGIPAEPFADIDEIGEQINVAAGSEIFKMIYANNHAGYITLPINEYEDFLNDDLDTGYHTQYQAFFMSETEVTFALLAEALQWAKDNGKISESGTHNLISPETVKYGNQVLVYLDYDSISMRLSYNAANGKFTVEQGYENYPAQAVTWYGAVMFCNWLTEMTEGNADNCVYSNIDETWDHMETDNDPVKTGYRLPSLYQWEHAARYIGHTAPTGGDLETEYIAQNFNGGSPELNPGHYWTPGWYPSGALYDVYHQSSTYQVAAAMGFPQQVKSKLPNATGIYDMSGNVAEWCWDSRFDDEDLEIQRTTRGSDYNNTGEFSKFCIGIFNIIRPDSQRYYEGDYLGIIVSNGIRLVKIQ
ncbi:MAG: SUMF1/EgtB/PvdO family nonheme iron enzyme [Spirochaetes bacterium]|nr:SUMF1/EgtB/PvdO family nonheme iron enzyme [Spirochaetota bacterium]